jgi:hypothetical protein
MLSRGIKVTEDPTHPVTPLREPIDTKGNVKSSVGGIEPASLRSHAPTWVNHSTKRTIDISSCTFSITRCALDWQEGGQHS